MEQSPKGRSPWNSLEIVKLTTSFVTPFFLIVLSYLVWDTQRLIVERHDHDLRNAHAAEVSGQQAQENLRQLRTSIYNKAAPLLREILAYHFHVGDWKELAPADVLKMKRELDHSIYGHEAVLSLAFADLYYNFMREAFVSAGSWQGESRLRTSAKCRAMPADQDETKWRSWFTDEDNRAAFVRSLQETPRELAVGVIAASHSR